MVIAGRNSGIESEAFRTLAADLFRTGALPC